MFEYIILDSLHPGLRFSFWADSVDEAQESYLESVAFDDAWLTGELRIYRKDEFESIDRESN